MVNYEESDAGPGRGAHGGEGGQQVPRSQQLEEGSGARGDQPITAGPHPANYAAPQTKSPLVPKAPGLGTQAVAFSQAELERVLHRPYPGQGPAREGDRRRPPSPLLRPDSCRPSECFSGPAQNRSESSVPVPRGESGERDWLRQGLLHSRVGCAKGPISENGGQTSFREVALASIGKAQLPEGGHSSESAN